jgi:hypothetical protein
MKTLAASAIVLVTLCAPAIAEPTAPPDSLKIRFVLRDTTTTHFDVIVGAAERCATANAKHPEREIQLRACLTDDAHLKVEWFTRSSWGEYRSTSSVPAVRGATAELGSANGPRLTVTVQ